MIALTLEHYPGMTEKALGRIVDEAERRWELTGCTVIHRIGRLLPGENIVFVAAASPHREAALQATAFLIDWLKTSAPFWKSEEYESGETAWVAARTLRMRTRPPPGRLGAGCRFAGSIQGRL